MAKLSNGILGKITGKVGNVVGSKWKDKNTIRAYSKPSNPNSFLQTIQRNKFKKIMQILKPAYNAKFFEYMRGVSKSISGINLLMSQALKRSYNPNKPEDSIILPGKLQALNFADCSFDIDNFYIAPERVTQTFSNSGQYQQHYLIVNVTKGTTSYQNQTGNSSTFPTEIYVQNPAMTQIGDGGVLFYWVSDENDTKSLDFITPTKVIADAWH